MSPFSATHRRFTSAEEWHSAIAPHLPVSRYARRAASFSLWGRLERLGETLLLDSCVATSGLGPANDTYGLSIDPHEMGGCYLLLQREGRGFVRQGDRTTELRAGEWAIFDASVPTSFLVPDRSRTIGLAFHHRYCEHWPRFELGGIRLAKSATSRVALAMIFEALAFVEWPSQRVQASMELLLMDVVEASLSLCVAERNVLLPAAAKIQQVRQVVEAQINNPDLSPDDIGRSVGLSRRSLYRLFRRTNQTPMGFVQELRLERAARLLRHGSEGAHRISSVAYAVGFVDPTHFSRLFRARYGQSPRQWTANSEGSAPTW